MIRILVSACLLGERVRYDGGDAACDSGILARWRAEGRLLTFCPEVAGGLPVPRRAAEIVGGDGPGVLNGGSRVLDTSGIDVTSHFLSGARGALEAARQNRVRLAVLKDGSPSCGNTFVYDGSFARIRRKGQGVTAAVLSEAGIRVFADTEIEAAAAYLADLDPDSSTPNRTSTTRSP